MYFVKENIKKSRVHLVWTKRCLPTTMKRVIIELYVIEPTVNFKRFFKAPQVQIQGTGCYFLSF